MSDPAHIRQLCDQIHDALTLAEHPPSAKGGQGGGAGASRPPMPISILDAKEDLKAKLFSWARMIGDEANNGEGIVIDCDDDSYSIAAWIYTKADWLAKHPAADDFEREITEKIRSLREPYSTPANLEYCGQHVGEQIYVRRGQTTVTLADGTVERVETLKAHMRHQMTEVIGPPSLVADIIQVYFQGKVTAKNITTAYSDDHNPQRPAPSKVLEPASEEGRRKCYRVSDVLERFGMSHSGIEESAVS